MFGVSVPEVEIARGTPQIRRLLLQVLYAIRSERMLVEQLEYNLPFRWFVGLSVDEPVWDHSTFSKNRDRLLEADIARELFKAIVEQAQVGDSENLTETSTVTRQILQQSRFSTAC